VLYRSKDGKNERTFDALEWLAAMCSHVPNKGEQMVRYYGYYSNVCRGQRKKANEDGLVPSILQPDEPSKGYRKNWARLIQKICELDPLTCPKCHGPIAVIAFIEGEEVIKKILKHLGLWELTPPHFRRVKPRPVCVHRTGRPPPRSAKSQPLSTEPHIDYSDSQVPPLARLWRVCPPLEGPITSFMWTPYLPVRDRTQTVTRRTSCHEPKN
jgi:hypothetical protein